MEKFENKLSSNNKAQSPQKRMKLESDERTAQQEDDEEDDEEDEFSHPVPWQKVEAEGLDCDYALLLSTEEADQLFKQLEEEVVYSTGTAPHLLLQRTRRCRVVDLSRMFLFQGKKQRSRCLERCTASRESRPRMAMRV